MVKKINKQNIRKKQYNKLVSGNKNKSKESKIITERFLRYQSNQSKMSVMEDTINDILIPEDLLKRAKLLSNEQTLSNLKNSIEIYDINNEINYKYLERCGRIFEDNYKYLYTLNFRDRQKLVKEFNLEQKYYLTKSSKIILYELINFLIEKYTFNSKDKKKDRESEKELEKYQLEYYENFIIPVKEGIQEFQYYYFINLIFIWLKKNKEIAINSLKIFKDFFQKKQNIYKAYKVFQIIFRIDLIFFGMETNYEQILLIAKLMTDQKMEHKKAVLMSNKEKFVEDIAKIQINNKTILTLKNDNYKFKPNDYYFFDLDGFIDIQKIIKNKKWMSFDYCYKNRLNFCDDNIKKKAFFYFFKKILLSNVTREYYDNVKKYKYYKFPFDSNRIIDYFLKKIFFVELDSFWGIYNKEGFGIFVDRIKGKKPYGLGYGAYTITISHEIIMHALWSLINSNDKIKSSTFNPEQSYINEEHNEMASYLDDNGDKHECILFGDKVSRITIGGNHFLLNIENWDLTIKQFREQFRKNNVLKKPNILKKEIEELKRYDYIRTLFNNITYDNVDETIDSQSMSTRTRDKKVNNQNFVS